MPQPYNITNISTSRDFLQFAQHVNSLTGNLMGLAILIMIFAITFISMSHRPTKESMGYACFITWIISFFLELLTMISGTIFLITTVFMAISIVWLTLDKD